MSAALVLEDHLSAHSLVVGLRGRGFSVVPVGEIGLGGKKPDADLVRLVGERVPEPWVFGTLDLTITQDSAGFDWDRYAIAWVLLKKGLTGAAAEQAKQNIVHHHIDKIVRLRRGDHFSYTERSQFQHPPDLVTRR